MKKIKYLGLLLLIVFTFMYTDKIVSVINDNDDIMLEIKEQAQYYRIEPFDGIIKNDTIIPGINGREVDMYLSYNNMKHYKVFNPELLKFKIIPPKNSIKNNMNKYIIKGNSKNKNVSIVYILSNNMDNLLNYLDNDISINIFINYSYLENNMSNLVKFKNHEIYNYGDDGIYTEENIIIGNNIINNKTNSKGNYCLSIDKNVDTLNVCFSNKMWTIIPSICGGYIDIKNNVENGSIILLNNLSELNNVSAYLVSKGYNIVGLSKLLSENID